MRDVRLDIDRVRITGAPPGLAPARLQAAIRRGLERALAELPVAASAESPLHLPRLRVELPAGAGEAQIGDAVARALAAAVPQGSGAS